MSPLFIFMCGVTAGVILSLVCCWALAALVDEPMIWGRR